jgi:hypothetical protein
VDERPDLWRPTTRRVMWCYRMHSLGALYILSGVWLSLNRTKLSTSKDRRLAQRTETCTDHGCRSQLLSPPIIL